MELGYDRIAVPEIDAAVWIAWSDRGLTQLSWSESAASSSPEPLPEGAVRRRLPQPYARTLQRYFEGREVDPAELPVDLAGTPFQLRVWSTLRKIPRGSVRSYAGIAADIGKPRAMRAVGMANGRNPVAIVVPCHRVVEKNFGLGGYSSGLRFKRFLLALEGVDVAADRVKPGQLALI